MPEPLHDLLTEPLLSSEFQGQRQKLTLPGLLAALSRGEEREFPALRPHQQHPWHAFLCQLGALAVHHKLRGEFPVEEATWHDALLALGGGRRESWCLVVPDLKQPAFFQPPVPEGSLKGFSPITTPDELDVLATAKNHDIKMAPSRSAAPESWILSLVTLQTFQGFFGNGNYGVARINGGYGSRPHVGFLSADSSGARFLRDTRIWLKQRDQILEEHDFAETGISLLWRTPWDGTDSRPLDQLDPFVIEVCRRVRLTTTSSGLLAYGTTTKAARIDAKNKKGNLGDIWMPLKLTDPPEAISIPASGFHYTRTQALILGQEYKAPPAQEPPAKGSFFWLGQVLSRGQGTTEGYHERLVPIPPRVQGFLREKMQRDRLAGLAKDRVRQASDARLKVLSFALKVLLQGGPEKLDNKDSRPERWLVRFDQQIDSLFFERLWEDATISRTEADARWNQLLVDLAWSQLQQATHEAPVPLVRRFRAIAQAERAFLASARKHFQTTPTPSRNHDDRTSTHAHSSGTQGASRPGGSPLPGDLQAGRE
jgi:CRISPR system Cascade subunit CasA